MNKIVSFIVASCLSLSLLTSALAASNTPTCDKRYSNGDYFYLRVVGDSMSPKIENDDLVLVHKQSSVDSGNYAVVVVDDENGCVKKVKYDSDWIELHSINPIKR